MVNAELRTEGGGQQTGGRRQKTGDGGLTKCGCLAGLRKSPSTTLRTRFRIIGRKMLSSAEFQPITDIVEGKSPAQNLH